MVTQFEGGGVYWLLSLRGQVLSVTQGGVIGYLVCRGGFYWLLSLRGRVLLVTQFEGAGLIGYSV